MNGNDVKSKNGSKPEAKNPNGKTVPGKSSQQPQQPPQKKHWVVIGLIILLLVAATIGLFWWLHVRHRIATDDAFIDTHVVHIAAQVPGRVLRVLAQDNQSVKAGDALMEIDPADYQARLNQALAAQASATGSLAQAEAQLKVAQANVDELLAEVKGAKATAANASEELKRNKPLAANQFISYQQLDTYSTNAKSNAANLDATHRKEAAAEAQLKLALSQIETAEANQKSADAQVEQAQLNLSYTHLIASEDGHIAERTVADGDYIQPGQALMTLVPDRVWITANYKETQISDMRPGQSVKIEIDAYPDKKFRGHVDSIQSGGGEAFTLLPPENATGNYVKIVQRVPVKIVFDSPIDPNIYLGPGMSVVPIAHVQP